MAAVLTHQDRRRSQRGPAARIGVGDLAVLRPGVSVRLVAISAVGTLVESDVPVRPDARSELTLDGPGGRRWTVNVRVLRCWVAALAPMRYQAAMAFERALERGSE
ncbi:MAG: hypothetical protein R2745_25895 [Vicinamibacterales bacterium]